MTDDRYLWLARMIGLSGLFLLVFSGIGGVLLASRTAQRMKLFKGKTFTLHRRFSLLGAALFLLHPIPILFAPKTTGGLSLLHVVVPFTAPKQTLWIGLGVVAAYLLLLGQSQKLPNRFFQQHGGIEESFAGVVSNVRQ